MAARRAAILEAARALLAEKGVTDSSLRELSQRVGLAKSNVLRYFDSREAIFLELLDDECRSWLADIEALLGKPRPRKPGYASEHRVAVTIADSLAQRRLMCELVSAMAVVLERNISLEYARDIKARAVGNTAALGELVTRHLPWLSSEFAAAFAEGVFVLTAGMYPFSAPTESVRAAMVEMGMEDPRDRFTAGLREGLVTWLVGAAVRAQPSETADGPARRLT
jgi:AcrR family transcriptional regulator